MPANPSIFVAITPALRARLFAGDAIAALNSIGTIALQQQVENLKSAELAKCIGEFDAVITGWGTPAFDDSVLAAAKRLRIVAHSAGSIKHVLPPALFERGIVVTHAAAAIAPAVAEMSLTLTLMFLRRVPQFMDAMRTRKSWDDAVAIGYGPELSATRVGVVGAGHTGRCFIRMLRALDAEVWVFDPHLTSSHASDLGVRKTELNELLSQCAVVSLQAPSTRDTHHMIGRKELALMRWHDLHQYRALLAGG